MGDKVLVTRSYMADIGDAIRGQVGGSQTYRPSEMAPAIRAFPKAQDTALLEKGLAGTYENEAASCIGSYMLAGNRWLTAASFPACREIGPFAFASCQALGTVHAPGCIAIQECAFMSCGALAKASFPECRTVGASAFYGCSALSSASLPECAYVGMNAFLSCSALGSLSLPAASGIAGSAFYGCASLSALWLMGPSVATLSSVTALYSTPMSRSAYLGYYGSIYVPASLYSEYVSAANWSYYSGRIVSVEG